MRKYTLHSLASILILLMPACHQKSHIQKAASEKKAAFSFEDIETNIDIYTNGQVYSNPDIEAYLFDIPLMVGMSVHQVADNNDTDKMYLGACTYNLDAVQKFYVSAMEHQGWQRLSILEGPEITMVFQKPQKICVLSVRATRGQSYNQCKSLITFSISSKTLA
jgi:hypothetical protein